MTCRQFRRWHVGGLVLCSALLVLTLTVFAQVPVAKAATGEVTSWAHGLINSLGVLAALIIGVLGFVHNRLQARDTKIANARAEEAARRAEAAKEENDKRRADEVRLNTFLNETLERLKLSEARNDENGKTMLEFRLTTLAQLKRAQDENDEIRNRLNAENDALKQKLDETLEEWKNDRHALKGLLQHKELELEKLRTEHEHELGEIKLKYEKRIGELEQCNKDHERHIKELEAKVAGLEAVIADGKSKG